MNQINGFLVHCVSALLQNCPPQELTSLFIFFVTKLSLSKLLFKLDPIKRMGRSTRKITGL